MPSRQRDTRIRLRRLFTQGITVLDVAEPFISFDAARPAVEVRQRMEERLLTVVGVRRDGRKSICHRPGRTSADDGCQEGFAANG